MPKFEIPQSELTLLIQHLQQYFKDELEMNLGDLPARLLLDFLGPKLGHAYYNRAIADARAVLANQMQSLDENLYGLERAIETK